jgi:hypothetical protein
MPILRVGHCVTPITGGVGLDARWATTNVQCNMEKAEHNPDTSCIRKD